MDTLYYLDDHPRVKLFYFYTHFTMLDEDTIKRRLSELSKPAL